MTFHPPYQLQSQDGTMLALHLWRAEQPRGSVLLVHGVGEHMQRYAHLAEALNREQWTVGGVDLRGHGLSEGKRGHVKRWSDYLADVQAAADGLPDPLYLVAHSMGSLVALDYLRTDKRVQAVSLSGPLLDFSVVAPRWKTSAASMLSLLAPRLSFANEIDAQDVCGSIDVVERYENDPLTFNTVTPRWFAEMRKALQRVNAHAPLYSLPALMQAGGQDRIISLAAAEAFYAAWGGDKQWRLWPEGRHEIFNEDFHPEVFRVLLDWLADQESARLSANSKTA